MAEDKPSFERKSLRQLEKGNAEKRRQRAKADLDRALVPLKDIKLDLPAPQKERKFVRSYLELEPQGKFEMIKGNPVKDGNPYFVDNPTYYFSLSPEQCSELEQPKPFFVDVTTQGSKTNKEVVPFVWDENISKSERFINAEKYTDGDSGLFALCAVSAETPEKQARLYMEISKGILEVHANNPHLIEEWLQKQSEKNLRGELDSINVFAAHEFKEEKGQLQLKPTEERLLVFKDGLIDLDSTSLLWEARIADLKRALEVGFLEKHHLRWIEFLSHAIDIPKIFTYLKSRSD